MTDAFDEHSLRVLILAPQGRDAALASALLAEAGIVSVACPDLPGLIDAVKHGAAAVLVTDEAMRSADLAPFHAWIAGQPIWSDLPILVLTRGGGGNERNPNAKRLTDTLGNVSFIERPFHPTSLVSLVESALRGRLRQYEARTRIETVRVAQAALEVANVTLEQRVEERTARLGEAQAALRQAQKLEAIGQLTGGIAHDFNNLLMVVSGGLEVMDRQKDPVRRQRLVDGMKQAAARGAKLTKQLLAFSRTQALKSEPVDLKQQIDGMASLLDHALGGSVQVESRLSDGLWPVEVDPTELELVMLNLCVNARDAMPKGGVIRIDGENESVDGRDHVRLRITDEGEGMAPDIQAKVFEPFFTTKDIGKGSGLGLAQVYGFIQQSGGTVEIQSVVGEGSSIIMTLPRAESEAVSPAAGEPTPAPLDRGDALRVLLVEDDEEVAALVGEMLGELGCIPRRVDSAASALEALAADPAVDLVLSDIMMPGGVSGIDLAAEIGVRKPDLPVLLTSGYPSAFEGAAAAHGWMLLPKPYGSGELQAAIDSVMRSRVAA